MSAEWFVYIVRCRDGTYYTGITTDVARRVGEHNDGKGSRYTAGRRPVELVHRERCEDRSAALKRELRIKRLPRRRKEDLIGTE